MTTPAGRAERGTRARLPGARIHPFRAQTSGVLRRDRLGGQFHEYAQVAYRDTVFGTHGGVRGYGIVGRLPGWTATRALAAGATEDEIADVLLAIAPVTELGKVAAAAPDVATGLGYDVGAALEELDDH